MGLTLAMAVGGAPLFRAAESLSSPPPDSSLVSFRPLDRWAVIGDSLTHTGTYHAYLTLFYLTRFPADSLHVRNFGIAGDTAAGGKKRLRWDVLPYQPTVATVHFGMNDVGRSLYAASTASEELAAQRRAAIAAFLASERALVLQLQERAIRVILVTPSLFDDRAQLSSPALLGVDSALGECSNGVMALAHELGCGVVDLHREMSALNQRRQETDPTFTLTGPDRIHPGPEGHFVMAYFFLKAQSAPQEVSALLIDAATLTVTRAANGQAAHLRRGKTGINFTWTEAALPFPLDPAFERATEWVPFNEELNREWLQIHGLNAGSYLLRIDDMTIRTVTAGELDRGLNLALEKNTPQYQQALAVSRAVQFMAHQSAETLRNLALVEHQTTPAELLPAGLPTVRPFVEAKFESFKINVPSPNLLRIYRLYQEEKPREADSLAAIEALEIEARRLAQPRSHTYEIVPVSSPAP